MPATESASADELLVLARDQSADARGRLTEAVSQILFRDGETPNAREQVLAVEILNKLIREAEIPIRRALAERLSKEGRAPRELVVRLANDEFDVAQPILIDSPVIGDADLLEVVAHRTRQHQLAVAMRKEVSESVSQALVATGHDDVACTLLDNKSARIAQETYEKLVDRSRLSAALQEPLLKRSDLEPEFATKMYGWVSQALRTHIAMNFDVDSTHLDKAIGDTLNQVISDHTRAQALGDTRTKLADAMGAGVIDDPNLLLRVLRAGEVALFEALFAKFTGLKITLARRVIYEAGGQALAIACKAKNIDRALFVALFLLARKGRAGKKPNDSGEMSAALATFEGTTAAEARDRLEAWRTGKKPAQTSTARDWKSL